MRVANAQSLGDVVHTRRTQLGWTQARLAAEMGVSRVWVTEFENGKGTAQLRLALDALAVLGLRLDVEPDQEGPSDA